LWAGRFATTSLPPFKVRKGNMGKTSKEIVQLRKKALAKKEYLSRLQQLSWRIKKVEELYPLNTQDPEELSLLISEYDDIYKEFIHIAGLELSTTNYAPYPFEKGGAK
jgi:hypothetical protein